MKKWLHAIAAAVAAILAVLGGQYAAEQSVPDGQPEDLLYVAHQAGKRSA